MYTTELLRGKCTNCTQPNCYKVNAPVVQNRIVSDVPSLISQVATSCKDLVARMLTVDPAARVQARRTPSRPLVPPYIPIHSTKEHFSLFQLYSHRNARPSMGQLHRVGRPDASLASRLLRSWGTPGSNSMCRPAPAARCPGWCCSTRCRIHI